MGAVVVIAVTAAVGRPAHHPSASAVTSAGDGPHRPRSSSGHVGNGVGNEAVASMGKERKPSSRVEGANATRTRERRGRGRGDHGAAVEFSVAQLLHRAKAMLVAEKKALATDEGASASSASGVRGEQGESLSHLLARAKAALVEDAKEERAEAEGGRRAKAGSSEDSADPAAKPAAQTQRPEQQTRQQQQTQHSGRPEHPGCPAPVTDFKQTSCARHAARFAKGVEGDAYTKQDAYLLCTLPHDDVNRKNFPRHPEVDGSEPGGGLPLPDHADRAPSLALRGHAATRRSLLGVSASSVEAPDARAAAPRTARKLASEKRKRSANQPGSDVRASVANNEAAISPALADPAPPKAKPAAGTRTRKGSSAAIAKMGRDIDVKLSGTQSRCASDDEDCFNFDAADTAGRPYQIPSGDAAVKWPGLQKNHTPFVYVFVHVVKTGGTSFEHHLMELAGAMGVGESEKDCVENGSDLSDTIGPYQCLMDATSDRLVDVVGRMQTRSAAPESHFSNEYMRGAYAKGMRMLVKGEYGMGLCDVTAAPCAYVTILREPIERLVSFYRYICLQGAENHGDWNTEWDVNDAAGCPLDIAEFYDARLRDAVNPGFTVNRHVHALAPGGDPSSSCSVEVAKANLVAPCSRYLLFERMEDGLLRLPWVAPDFGRVRAEEEVLNVAEVLSDVKQARLDGYLRDEHMMARLRTMAAADLELYKFATDKYDEQWSRKLDTC